MFQVISMWNFSRLNGDISANIEDISLRGYSPRTYLTGQFARKIAEREIPSLSVSDISYKYCPSRRDLYFKKGVSRLRTRVRGTWSQSSGTIVEKYIDQLLKKRYRKTGSYSEVSRKSGKLHNEFLDSYQRDLSKLKSLETRSSGIKEGDTEWLINLLSRTGRAELGIKILHSVLKEKNSLDRIHLKRTAINPNSREIGISSPAHPDFTIPKFGVVGDVKTGIVFRPHFQLTCAGYALAYENEKGKGKDINWGIIYFVPTRNPSAFVRPITFAQIYIFPVDDQLRRWFIQWRNDAYDLISRKVPPELPLKEERAQCQSCRFNDNCYSVGEVQLKQGLILLLKRSYNCIADQIKHGVGSAWKKK